MTVTFVGITGVVTVVVVLATGGGDWEVLGAFPEVGEGFVTINVARSQSRAATSSNARADANSGEAPRGKSNVPSPGVIHPAARKRTEPVGGGDESSRGNGAIARGMDRASRRE